MASLAEYREMNGSNGAASGAPKSIETRLFINNEFREASDKGTFKVVNPATLETVAEVSEATVEDTNAAVAAAKQAQPAWAALSPAERGGPLKKFSALMMQHAQELAWLETSSMGRPISSFFDAHFGATLFEAAASQSWTAHGKTSLNTPGKVAMTFRQPWGVCAAVIPWNAPIIFFAMKLAPALAAGNTVVLKSSEKAPLTSAKLASLIVEAGFPAGVINVLSGHGAPCGSTLSSHMDVRLISFTGSARTGKLIQAAAAQSNLKQVVLELGGKSPAVVFPDADLEKAAKDLMVSIQGFSGQQCMASSRVYVEETIADQFVEKYKANMLAHAKFGNPLDAATTHGPQADKVQFDTVRKYIEMGKSESDAKLILGGNQYDGKGYYQEPTVFMGMAENARMMKEEVFGTVVNINTFKAADEAEILRRCNDTEYGLYASVYTKDINRALRFAKGMEAGTVGVNCTSPSMVMDMPFGGYKQSGQSREGMLDSFDHYLEVKTVIIDMTTDGGNAL